MTTRTRICVAGTVQGVGFRPFVYRHAVALGLVGFVCNDSTGLTIEVEGSPGAIAELVRLLTDAPPPLAIVTNVTSERLPPTGTAHFTIESSEATVLPTVPVSVDTATCEDCLAEMNDASDRRFQYAFINCTSCGPRYTIVRSLPYDRPTTTMSHFVMCANCQREYDDPNDRRFHAQPNACPACGPRLSWWTKVNEVSAQGTAALDAAVHALRNGGVVAIKGVGGYHFAADATDESAVTELRRRKARDEKPFAVMVADLQTASGFCHLDEVAMAALESFRRPIVIAPRCEGAAVAPSVAPGLSELGVMLPYSPLHDLLLTAMGRPLVMTSGNYRDEPIAHEDADAMRRLGPIVDGMLTHDRPIHIRCDDSVARLSPNGRLQLLRRSRGYAPEPLALPLRACRSVLALGAELKNTVAVARDGFVVASHHIGDLEHLATYESFEQAINHLRRLYDINPQVVAHDMHPEYLSTKFAMELDLPTLAVQHHHAHVAACMTEHRRVEPVLGLAFDGLGYGPDGSLWGGEFLIADLQRYKRVGHLRPVTLPGGTASIREPWRMALVWALEAGTDFDGHSGGNDQAMVRGVRHMIERGQGPRTTSVGRLFDAVGVLLGAAPRAGYEAQAAITLEAMARKVPSKIAPVYSDTVEVQWQGGLAILDPSSLVATVIRERDRASTLEAIAAGFHETLGRAVARLAVELAGRSAVDTVALTGGVFQNVRLTEVVERELVAAGMSVLIHQRVPANDGGISIGQAAIAAISAT
ncbi:MAG: carbamoyltransferase HypF [Acidimicrobiales bacterium]